MNRLRILGLFLGLLTWSTACKKELTVRPRVSIGSAINPEGNSGTATISFVLSLSEATTVDVTVDFATIDGTAMAGQDYESANGTVTIAAGMTETTIDVSILSDTEGEEDEQFEVIISNAANADINRNTGVGVIENDDEVIRKGYSTPDAYAGMTLVWRDEFDGTALNTQDWNYETGNHGWGNNELQNYVAGTNNTKVTNGVLTVEAQRTGSTYSSARLTTQGKKSFKYGRIDIRAILPQGQGLWPALWMLGENFSSVGWPDCGEIDIMELVGHEPAKVHGTVHWEHNGHASFGGGTSLSTGVFADEFHVFTIIWDEQAIRWYLDDVEFHVIDISGLPEFHEDFFFIFNVAVGGNWPGNPDATTRFPQTMVVDYVRMFQKA